MADTREVGIILKLKQQLNQEMGSAAATLQSQIKSINSASKELNQTHEETAKATKNVGLNFVDMAAKLYLVQVAFRAVADALAGFIEIGRKGAEIEQINTSFERMIGLAGGTTDVIEKMKVATHGTVSELDLMTATNQALAGAQGEFREKLLESLPAIAAVARSSAILNPQLGDTTMQLERSIQALKKRQPALLDEMGMEIKLNDVNKEYADQLGITQVALTAQQSQVGLLNEFLERGVGLNKQAGSSAEGAVDPYMKLNVAWQELGSTIATRAEPAITNLAVRLTDLLTATDEWIKQNEWFVDSITHFIIMAATWGTQMNVFKYIGDKTAESQKHWSNVVTTHEDAVKALNDQRREEIELGLKSTEVNEELAAIETEAAEKFGELRDKSMNDLFIKEIKFNQKKLDIAQDAKDKLEEMAEEESDRLSDIYEDGERERLRITEDFADDRLAIEQDYNDRKADLEKDLSELQMELEGKNPFVDQATTDAITNQEALLKATKSNLETLKRDAKNGHSGPSMDAEIQATEDFARQVEDTLAQLKGEAREQERTNRLKARIAEKQEQLQKLQDDRDSDIASNKLKEEQKLSDSRDVEKRKTEEIGAEYDKREQKIKASFESIRDAAEKDFALATTEAMLTMATAGSDIELALTKLKYTQLGATDEMIKKYYQLRDSITGPNGVIAALQQMNAVSAVISNTGNYYGSYGGRRATGGGISGGHSYLVGEDGPEIVTSSGNATIIPNGGMGGGTVVVNINAGAYLGNRSDAAAFANLVGPLVAQWQSRYGGATNAAGTRNIKSGR